jgi:hypothetical protein
MAEGTRAAVRSIPGVKVFCWNCKQSELREGGTYCHVYLETIVVESAAQQCSLFAPRES